MLARLVFALVALAATTAHAGDGDVAKQLLDAEVRAINAGDAKAFAATLADDGFAILPAAADEAIGAPAIEAAAKRWLAATGKVSIKVEQLHIDKDGMAAGDWFDARLAGGPVTWRISGVIIRTMIEKNGELSEGPYKLAAIHISEPADDKAVLAAAADGKLPALPKLASDSPSEDHDPGKIARFARHVFDSSAVSLIGSAAKEHAVGKAAVMKQLAGWRTLKLATQAVKTGRDPQAMWGIEWSIGHVEATFTVKGKPVKVPYRALLIVYSPSAPAIDHGGAVELVSAHFSVATH